MLALIVQTALLLAIAFIAGAVLGSLAKRAFGTGVVEEDSTVVATYGLSRTPPATPAGSQDAGMPASRKLAAAPGPDAEAGAGSLPDKPGDEGAAPVAAPPPAASQPVPPAETGRGQPVPENVPEQAAQVAQVDDLQRIRGIGPQNAARLNAEGITAFAQIASWTKKDQAAWGERLAFPGRIEREGWVRQARALAREQEKAAAGPAAPPADEAAPGTRPRLLKAARRNKPDDLTRIGGIGKAIQAKLNGIGVFHYDQVAKWSPDEAAWVSHAIGFPGRVERENWTGEAARLAPSGSRKAGGARSPKVGPSRGKSAGKAGKKTK